jgi:hypothetical protein
MNTRRVLFDIVGSVLSAGAGLPYFMFMFGKAWDGKAEFQYLAMWIVLAVLAVGAVIVVLTILLRPARLWLYPLMFALVTLVFGFAAMEPAGVTWVLIGLVTVAVGWGWGYLTHSLSARLTHPNRTVERDGPQAARPSQ